MGQRVPAVVDTVARDSRYTDLFRRAFGDAAVTEERIGRAIAQFVRAMVSYQSKYDVGRTAAASGHDDFANFKAALDRHRRSPFGIRISLPPAP